MNVLRVTFHCVFTAKMPKSYEQYTQGRERVNCLENELDAVQLKGRLKKQLNCNIKDTRYDFTPRKPCHCGT